MSAQRASSPTTSAAATALAAAVSSLSSSRRSCRRSNAARVSTATTRRGGIARARWTMPQRGGGLCSAFERERFFRLLWGAGHAPAPRARRLVRFDHEDRPRTHRGGLGTSARREARLRRSAARGLSCGSLVGREGVSGCSRLLRCASRLNRRTRAARRICCEHGGRRAQLRRVAGPHWGCVRAQCCAAGCEAGWRGWRPARLRTPATHLLSPAWWGRWMRTTRAA